MSPRDPSDDDAEHRPVFDGDSEHRPETLRERVTTLAASPLLYVGAVTVVLGHEIADWLPLSETGQALALFPLALALLSGQLALLVLYRRRWGRDGRPRCA